MGRQQNNGRDHSGGPKLVVNEAEDRGWDDTTDPEPPAQVTNAAVLKAVGHLVVVVSRLEKTVSDLGDKAAAVAAGLRAFAKWALRGLAVAAVLGLLAWWLW